MIVTDWAFFTLRTTLYCIYPVYRTYRTWPATDLTHPNHTVTYPHIQHTSHHLLHCLQYPLKHLTLFWAFISAPLFISSSTTSVQPCTAAHISGVRPSWVSMRGQCTCTHTLLVQWTYSAKQCSIQDVTRHKESCHSCVVLVDITVLLYINILFISYM